MLKVHTFALPAEEEKANAFLAENRPEGEILFQNGNMIVLTEDGTYHPNCEIGELNEMLVSARAARHQQEVALAVLEHDLARPALSKKDEDDYRSKKTLVEEAIKIQHAKEAFLVEKIADLRG